MTLQEDLQFYFSRLPSLFLLFRKSDKFDKILDEFVKTDEAATTDFSRIRCPLCRWQPRKSSRWYCSDAGFPEFFFGGCGTQWNTFDTGGRCPGCGHQWIWTSCLRCGQNSKHVDWYEDKQARE